jgi:hypothetical protein
MVSKVARFRRRRARLNPEALLPKSGPVTERAYDVAAAFGAYAATRVLGRTVYQFAGKRWPGLKRHLAVAATGAGVIGAYYLAQYWDAASEYEDAVVLGSGVAAAQAAVQTYLPRYSNLISDWQEPRLPEEAAGGQGASVTVPGALSLPALPERASSSNPDAELDRILAENDLEAVPLSDYSDADEVDIPGME